MKSKEPKALEESLIDLYLNVKVRKQEEIENMNPDIIKEEKENLRKLNPLKIIEYIKTSVDILINVKVEEKFSQLLGDERDSDNKMSEYEPLLKKLESDIRQHIKMEHQLKLHSESLQSRVEELEEENLELHNRIRALTENQNHTKTQDSKEKKDLENAHLRNEIHNMKQIIKSYEDQSIKTTELEKKLKNIFAKHEKELKNLEEKYEEKIKILNRKISKFEEITRTNNSFKSNYEEVEKSNDYNINPNREFYSHVEIPKKKGNRSNASKSPVGTDRNGISLKDRIEQYKRLIDKNLQDISHSNVSSNKTKSGSMHGASDRTHSNQSFVKSESSGTNPLNPNNPNNPIKTHKRADSLFKNLEKATRNILSKQKYNTHNRNCSMEIKQTSDHKILEKSPVNALSGSNKNINTIKEIILNNKQNKIPKPNHQRQTSSINNPASNIILNQGGNPCINQITIFTTNNPNGNQIKNGDLNLRKILNKSGTNVKHSNNSKIPSGHTRNPSKNNL